MRPQVIPWLSNKLLRLANQAWRQPVDESVANLRKVSAPAERTDTDKRWLTERAVLPLEGLHSRVFSMSLRSQRVWAVPVAPMG